MPAACVSWLADSHFLARFYRGPVSSGSCFVLRLLFLAACLALWAPPTSMQAGGPSASQSDVTQYNTTSLIRVTRNRPACVPRAGCRGRGWAGRAVSGGSAGTQADGVVPSRSQLSPRCGQLNNGPHACAFPDRQSACMLPLDGGRDFAGLVS